MEPPSSGPQTGYPAGPGHPLNLTDPLLAVLLITRGLEIERDGEQSVYRLGRAYFLADRRFGRVRGPYADMAAVFRHHGTVFLEAPGAEILEWGGLVLSREAEGSTGGPYPSLDDWIWGEATLLDEWMRGPGGAPKVPGRYIHEWRGFYFVTLDPFPAVPRAFRTLPEALGHLPLVPVAPSPRIRAS